jgi:hypothetical protein
VWRDVYTECQGKAETEDFTALPDPWEGKYRRVGLLETANGVYRLPGGAKDL